MRRADRLFRLIQFMRRSRLVTAKRLAETLEVSERTVYRDIRDLSLSGVPIRGEAGVGYALAHGFDLPPLMFEEEEIEALVLGARVVQAWADPQLARAADSALSKIEMVLPEKLRARLGASALLVPSFRPGTRAPHLGVVRAAIREARKLRMVYRAQDAQVTDRVIWPLAVAFWGKIWTIAAWCEARQNFRSFRLDRILEAELTDRPFPREPGKMLDDFIRHVTQSEHSRTAQE